MTRLGPYEAFRAAVTSLLPRDGVCPPELFAELTPREIQTVAGAGIAMTANLVNELAAVGGMDPHELWRQLIESHRGSGGALDVEARDHRDA